MSASREKKQRQDIPEHKLTQKQRKEQEEAQARRRKTIIYTIVGVILAILVAALLIWHSGFFQSRTTAMTVGDRNYTPTDVAYYYHQALNTEYMYGQMLGSSNFDPSVDPKEQYTDEEQTTTYYDQFMQSAQERLIRVTALLDAAEAEGYSNDAEVQAYVDTQMESLTSSASSANYPNVASYLKAVYGRYMTESRFRQCLEREGLANAYYNDHQDSLTYDDAALESYYQENKDDLDTYSYDVCFINGTAADPVDENGDPVTDEEGNTVTATEEEQTAAMDAARTSADEMVAALNEGGDFAALAQERVDADEASTYSGDQSTVGSSLSSTYKDWMISADRTEGDIETFETEGSGVYVVRFNGRARDDESLTDGVRHILIQAETTDEDEVDDNGNPVPTDEAMQAAHDRAQELLDQWAAGDATAESFGALAEEYSDDPGSNTNGGLYTGVTTSSGYFQGFLDWIFADGRQVGDTGLVENTQSGQQGWHIMYLDSQAVTWKYTADSALRSADMTEWIDGLTANYTAAMGNGEAYVTDQ